MLTNLAINIGVSCEAIGKHERNEAIPSVEAAMKIADIFEVTLDCFFDETTSVTFDKQTVKRIQDIEILNSDDKNHLFGMMHAFHQRC